MPAPAKKPRTVVRTFGPRRALAAAAAVALALTWVPSGSSWINAGASLQCSDDFTYSWDDEGFPAWDYDDYGSNTNTYSYMDQWGDGYARAKSFNGAELETAWGAVYSDWFAFSGSAEAHIRGSSQASYEVNMGNIGTGGHSASAFLKVGLQEYYTNGYGDASYTPIDQVTYAGGIGYDDGQIGGSNVHVREVAPGTAYRMVLFGEAKAYSAWQTSADIELNPLYHNRLELCWEVDDAAQEAAAPVPVDLPAVGRP